MSKYSYLDLTDSGSTEDSSEEFRALIDDDSYDDGDDDRERVKIIRGNDETSEEEINSIDESESEEDQPHGISSMFKNAQDVIIVNPQNRKTTDIMSNFEMTDHVGIRAAQIEMSGLCMVDTMGLTSPIEMAKLELMQRKSPLILERRLGYRLNKMTGKKELHYEYWSPNEMQFATCYQEVMHLVLKK